MSAQCDSYLYTFIPSYLHTSAFWAGRSRLTLITGNRGCVRYPTEGNSSNHELTTAMQHLSIRLAATDVSASLRMDF